MAMIDLTGKVALVTGSSRGIGAATALMLAEVGATVVLNYSKSQSKARTVANRIKKMTGVDDVLTIKADVGKSDEVKKMFQKIKSFYDKLDILVNNAAIWTMAPIISMADSKLHDTLETNLVGVVNCIREGAKLMRSNGSGVIINVSSTAGRRGEAFYSHYAATKAALLGLTKSLAVELASYNIRVNAIAPGWVNTEMSSAALKEKGNNIKDKIPLGRVAEPEEIAGPIVFLCSDLATFITGATLDINGGGVLID
jgi:3-oxoacyl-[acyl-carrier protein] reductase